MVTDTQIAPQDIPPPSAPLPSADEEMVTDKADSNECNDDACEAATSEGLLYWFLLLVYSSSVLICFTNLQTMKFQALLVWMIHSLVGTLLVIVS